MDKKAIRSIYLEKRKGLDAKGHALKSKQICEQAIDLIKRSGYSKIHLFLPITKQAEINTWPILHFLLNSTKHQPVLSKSNFNNHCLAHYFIEKETKITENKRGIPEPANAKEAKAEEIDMVFIPLIAFDKNGHRIGYGAGFYDRFLENCKPEVLKVGLSIDLPLDQTISAEAHDIKLDQCITPLKTFRFQ